MVCVRNHRGSCVSSCCTHLPFVPLLLVLFAHVAFLRAWFAQFCTSSTWLPPGSRTTSFTARYIPRPGHLFTVHFTPRCQTLLPLFLCLFARRFTPAFRPWFPCVCHLRFAHTPQFASLDCVFIFFATPVAFVVCLTCWVWFCTYWVACVLLFAALHSAPRAAPAHRFWDTVSHPTPVAFSFLRAPSPRAFRTTCVATPRSIYTPPLPATALHFRFSRSPQFTVRTHWFLTFLLV